MMFRRRALTAHAVLLACFVVGPAWLAARQEPDEATREKWQRVEDIYSALGIREGSRVADVGAGEGFFTVRLARKVGRDGRVLAVDVRRDRVDQLRARAKNEGLINVDVIHSEPADPKLPAGALDAVLIVNAYHEMKEYRSILEHVRRALKPGGRLVLVEPKPWKTQDFSRSRQQDAHVLDPALAEADLREAGFQIVERRDEFLERPKENPEWLIVAESPGPQSRAFLDR